ALALCCFVLIGFTGLITAPLRFSSWEDLSSAYAAVVGLKAVALAGLGGFGWWHRRVSMPALARGQAHIFARIAWVEVLVMAAGLGLAAGLGRTLPPNTYRVRDQVGTPVQRIVDALPNPLFLAFAVAAVACYLIGVRRLRRQGQAWPIGRTIAWIVGWAVVVAANDLQLVRIVDGTRAGPDLAGDAVGAGEALQYLAVVIVAPILLAFAGAVRLAEKSLRASHESGMRGPLEWLDVVRHAGLARVLRHPAAAFGGYAVVLYGAYVSTRMRLGEAAPSSQMMILGIGLAGSCLFYTILMAGGSMQDRVSRMVRGILGLATVFIGASFVLADITMESSLPAAVQLVTVSVLSGIIWMVHRSVNRAADRPRRRRPFATFL
ncbi:hypothetical protein DMB66_58425, partial [Actinoplanes sp. ATCC 53533]|uniref:bifunctional copper resistance protein CopD/cytochrome c oxidase assembly protein n=1 Tax=Actinoplanes sp. ATCC 53533 TaxID=1288362 RepID=UPI0010005213